MIGSIIIATRDRCQALRETLATLAEVAIPDGLRVELIVVDNGSLDATPAAIAGARFRGGAVRHVPEPRRGKANALNTALTIAQGDILVFLDDDVRPAPDWLEHITAPIAQGRSDALAGIVQIAPELTRPWMTPAHRAWLAETNYLNAIEPEAAVGANMAIARRVLGRVPRFDPELGPGKLGLWEDTLFSSQLRRAGFRLSLAPQARVTHHFDPARLTHAALLAHAQAQGRSSGYVAWHWQHDRSTPAWRDSLHYRLRLLTKRLLRRRECQREEGAAMWELNLTCGIAFADQLRRERHRPPAYDRFGAVKLN